MKTKVTAASEPAKRDLRRAGGGEAIAPEDESGGGPGAESGKRGARDRGGLRVPRVTLLEPLGHVLDDRHENDEFRRQDKRGGDYENGDRLVGVVGSASDDEELAEGGGYGEIGERAPTLGVVAEDERSERRRGRRKPGRAPDRGFASRGCGGGAPAWGSHPFPLPSRPF